MGMDPVTAIGLASAIISLVHLGTKIANRLNELSSADDIPEVFRDIRTRLPLFTTIVDRTQHGIDKLSPESQESFRKIIGECYAQISRLDDILEKIMISKGESRARRALKACVSLIEERNVKLIAASLIENVELLAKLSHVPGGQGKPSTERRPSEPLLSYAAATGVFLVPFSRDEHFISREHVMESISASFEKQKRVAVSGIGGVGKSQVAIEFCYRYKERQPDSHIFWVYGGNIARFYQAYKRIAQLLELPGWDDPETSILELVSSWLSSTRSPFLLVIDNADNIEHWWPGKYTSGPQSDSPSKNLSSFLPVASENGLVLITTRDNRVAGRLTKQAKPIIIESMSTEDAKSLFLSKFASDAGDFEETEICRLVNQLDCLPLAVSQAAAFIEESEISIVDYISALQGEAEEEYLFEELDDVRRDDEHVNSVFRTWKLSYDKIMQHNPRAIDLLCLLAMLDRQSIPKWLLKVADVTTSINVLRSFSLITARAGSQTFQIHRLVQRFVRVSLHREGESQKWKETALACVANAYPTEIGVAEWPTCDALAPHVQIVTSYCYETVEARLDMAHLLCWAADFDVERGMYSLALEKAQQSLVIFQELAAEQDQRLAAATWLVGRLRYYEAKSTDELDEAAELLEKALRISDYPSLNYAESAFELAHLYCDQSKESSCLQMGKASFECWKALEGPSSVRTLDNMHDYALELAMFGHKERGITMWQEILELCPASDASENTKTVFTYRSMAGIAEFQGDAAMAEILYAKLITLSEAIYKPDHVHVFDYLLSHAEQVMRQGRHGEAIRLSQAILEKCKNLSEWRIYVSGLQTIAECHRLSDSYEQEEAHRLNILKLHEENLGDNHKETTDAREALADCNLNRSKYVDAQDLYRRVISWRTMDLGQNHGDTVRAIECLGICYAGEGRDADAEASYLDALGQQNIPDARLLNNLLAVLWNQGKWERLEFWARQTNTPESEYYPSVFSSLITALEKQGKSDEALRMRTDTLSLLRKDSPIRKPLPTKPPIREKRRFGRMVHPRTWSA